MNDASASLKFTTGGDKGLFDMVASFRRSACSSGQLPRMGAGGDRAIRQARNSPGLNQYVYNTFKRATWFTMFWYDCMKGSRSRGLI